jgi:DNA-binding MurR/RpiR family transcriptional regulator
VLLGIAAGRPDALASAFAEARRHGITTIAFLAEPGGTVRALADVSLVVPSREAPRVREVHAVLGDVLCAAVEQRLHDSGWFAAALRRTAVTEPPGVATSGHTNGSTPHVVPLEAGMETSKQ